MTPRKFYKRDITYTVLSETPIPDDIDMQQIVFECVEGSYSGAVTDENDSVLDGKQMADALKGQGSDPSFFQLTPEGSDIK